MKSKLAIVGYIIILMFSFLAAAALWDLWRDGSWDPNDAQVGYATEVNSALVAAGALSAALLWRSLRR